MRWLQPHLSMLHERIHTSKEHLRMPHVGGLFKHRGRAEAVVDEWLERGGCEGRVEEDEPARSEDLALAVEKPKDVAEQRRIGLCADGRSDVLPMLVELRL